MRNRPPSMRGADAVAARLGSAMLNGLSGSRNAGRPYRPGAPEARRSVAAEAPATVAPRLRPGRAGRNRLRRRIESRAAPGMAATDARSAHPRPGPSAVTGDRLVGIGRATRQVAALPADQARQRELVEPNQRMRRPARRERGHDASAVSALFRAIWPRASATASNVSRVEAWRAR